MFPECDNLPITEPKLTKLYTLIRDGFLCVIALLVRSRIDLAISRYFVVVVRQSIMVIL